MMRLNEKGEVWWARPVGRFIGLAVWYLAQGEVAVAIMYMIGAKP